MPWNLTVIVEDRPGGVAALGEAAGSAGINLAGVSGAVCEGKGVVHLLVDDAAEAETALRNAGFEVDKAREVLIADVADRPGAFGEVCRRIADAGISLDLVYLATNTRLVLGAEDLNGARAALS
jgi:hypothetical protein